MSMANKLFKAFMGGPLYVVLFGLIFFGIGAGLTYRQHAMEARGVETEGRVVSLSQSCDDDGCTYSPVVRFNTRGGQSITFESSYSSSPPAYDVGEQVTIIYLPDDPEKAVIQGEGQLFRIIFMIVGGGVIIFGLWVFTMRVRDIFRIKDEPVIRIEDHD